MCIRDSKETYARGERVLITVLATDGGSPPVPQAGVYTFVEVVTASGSIYIGEQYTGDDGAAVYQFRPKVRDGYGTYLVTALGESGEYADADITTFEVVK